MSDRDIGWQEGYEAGMARAQELYGEALEQERQRCVTRAQMAMEHRGLRWADVKAVMDHLEQR
jgi:hypothetical protein